MSRKQIFLHLKKLLLIENAFGKTN